MNTFFKAALLATVVLSTPAVVFADDTGVAAGSNQLASSTANGSTATIVAAGVGAVAVIGAIVAGSSNSNGNGTTSTTSTTSTH